MSEMTDSKLVCTKDDKQGVVCFECDGQFIQVVVIQKTEQKQMYEEVLQVMVDLYFSLSMSTWIQHCSDLVTSPFWPVLKVTFFPVLSLVWKSDGMELGNDILQKRKPK